MYSRDFKIVVPIASQRILRDTEKKMAEHFGGVSVYPIVRGFWVDTKSKAHRMYEDENLVMVSTKEYKGQHPILEHQKDERFMDILAEDVRRKTHQKSIFEEEGLVGRVKFIEARPKRKMLEKMI
jgi:hypothetical protein